MKDDEVERRAKALAVVILDSLSITDLKKAKLAKISELLVVTDVEKSKLSDVILELLSFTDDIYLTDVEKLKLVEACNIAESEAY